MVERQQPPISLPSSVPYVVPNVLVLLLQILPVGARCGCYCSVEYVPGLWRQTILETISVWLPGVNFYRSGKMIYGIQVSTLAIGCFIIPMIMTERSIDKYLIAQAFFAQATQLLISLAQVLGKTDDIINTAIF